MAAEILEVGTLSKIIVMAVCLQIMYQSMHNCTDASPEILPCLAIRIFIPANSLYLCPRET